MPVITPIAPVDVSPGLTGQGSWYAIDVSSVVPAEATGVVVAVRNNHPNHRSIRVKPTGQSDEPWFRLAANSLVHLLVALDSDKKFHFYSESTTQSQWAPLVEVIGYTDDRVVLPQTYLRRDYIEGSTWVDVNLTANVGSDPAVALVALSANWEAYDIDIGWRVKGSTEDLRTPVASEQPVGAVVVGLNEGKTAQAYYGGFFAFQPTPILGYVKEGVEAYAEPEDITPETLGAWVDLPARPNAAALILGIFNADDLSNPVWGVRPKGSSENLTGTLGGAKWCIAPCGEDGVAQVYITGSDTRVVLMGVVLGDGTPEYEIVGDITATPVVEADMDYDTGPVEYEIVGDISAAPVVEAEIKFEGAMPEGLALRRIYQGTQEFASGEKGHVIDLEDVLGSAVDPEKTIVLLDTASASRARHNAFHEARLAPDGKTLTLERAGPNTTPNNVSEVSYKILEFWGGLTVRHISAHPATNKLGSAQPIGATVNRGRTFGLLSYRIDSTDNTSTGSSLALAIPSDTEYLLDNSAALHNVVYYTVQIVEFDADLGAFVQHVAVNAAGAETLVQLDEVADPAHTSIFGGASFGPSEPTSSNRCVAADLAEQGAILRLRKSGSSTSTKFNIMVVRWPNNVTVLTAEVPALTHTAANYTASIPEIDSWDNAAPYVSGGPPNFGTCGQSTQPVAQWWFSQPGDSLSEVKLTRRTSGFNHLAPTVVQVLAFGETAEPTPTWPDDLMEGLAQMPENRWRCPVLTPGKTDNWASIQIPSQYQNSTTRWAPNSVFYAWPCTILDTKREVLVGHGGGHGNHGGNEVYECDLHTGLWGVVALPTLLQHWDDTLPNYYGSPLGEDDAPPGAHCYSSSAYLPLSDVYVIHGGAVIGVSGRYKARDGGDAGPYIYDAWKRDPMKVGGATGTNKDPSIEGMNAWHNAYHPAKVTYRGFNVTAFVDIEDDKEVLYWWGGDGAISLYRTVINDPYDWSLNDQSLVGGSTGHQALSKAANVRSLGVVVGIRDNAGSNLTNALRIIDKNGAQNGRTAIYTASLADPDGILSELAGPLQYYSLVWDEVRDRIVGLGNNQLIEIRHQNIAPDGQENGEFVGQWSIHIIEATFDKDYRRLNDMALTSGQPHGKWHYYRKYDCFAYIESWGSGGGTARSPRLWFYKPTDWQPEEIPQTYEIEADELELPAVELGGPSLTQHHNVAPTALAGAVPEIGEPVLAQHHGFTATAIAGAAPELVEAAATQVHQLSADGITGAAAFVDTAVFYHHHILQTGGLVGETVWLGQPDLGQSHLLAAGEFSLPQVVVGQPVLGATQTQFLDAEPIVLPTPVLGSPALTQRHGFTAMGIAGAAPDVGNTSMSAHYVLEATSLEGASPLFDAPLLVVSVPSQSFDVDGIGGEAPVLGSPWLSQHQLFYPMPIFGTPPLPGVPLIVGPPALVPRPRSFRDIKRHARRVVHAHLSIPALYFTSADDPDPRLVFVRLHTKFGTLGDMIGTNFHYAEMQEMQLRALFMRSEVPNPVRGAIISIAPGEAYRIDNVLPPDDIMVAAEVLPLTPEQAQGLPTPEGSGW